MLFSLLDYRESYLYIHCMLLSLLDYRECYLYIHCMLLSLLDIGSAISIFTVCSLVLLLMASLVQGTICFLVIYNAAKFLMVFIQYS